MTQSEDELTKRFRLGTRKIQIRQKKAEAQTTLKSGKTTRNPDRLIARNIETSDTINLNDLGPVHFRDETATVSTTSTEKGIREQKRREQRERVLAETERIIETQSASNYDTAQEDVEEIHTDYSCGKEGALGPELDGSKNFERLTEKKTEMQPIYGRKTYNL